MRPPGLARRVAEHLIEGQPYQVVHAAVVMLILGTAALVAALVDRPAASLTAYAEHRHVVVADATLDVVPGTGGLRNRARTRLVLTDRNGQTYRTHDAIWRNRYSDETFEGLMLGQPTAEIWLDRRTHEIVGLHAGPVVLSPSLRLGFEQSGWRFLLASGVVLLAGGAALVRLTMAYTERLKRPTEPDEPSRRDRRADRAHRARLGRHAGRERREQP